MEKVRYILYSYIFGRAQSYTVTFRLLAVTDTRVLWTVTVTTNSIVNVKRRDVCIFFLDATRDLLTLYVVSFGSTVFGIIVIIFGISYYSS